MSASESTSPEGMVDGATGVDDGGREDGDVEMALFRRIRSLSGASGRRRLLRGPGESFHRYFTDPLSMFSAESRAAHTVADEPSSEGDLAPPPDGASSADEARDSQENDDDQPDDDSDGLQRYVSHGVAWRDAMVQACADLLGKSLEELQSDFHAATVSTSASDTVFGNEARSFEPLPRDLADYAIMTTLKVQDALAMQNATSWLFNMMDRTGAGYVLRDEFVRYAPFIGPVADAAVAGLVFDELVREQARRAAEDEASAALQDSKRNGPLLFRALGNRNSREEARKRSQAVAEGLRRRRRFRGMGSASSDAASRVSRDAGDDIDNFSVSTNGALSVSSLAGDGAPPHDLYPPAVALRYETWWPFFLAIQEKYHCHDDDWLNVKQQLGIDQGEILIKSQGALDHSDMFPTLGKLYLSQRYLIFFAAVGRNHYVARLGAVAEVSTTEIPIMMRDCLQIHLESEKKAAIDGVSALRKEENVEAGSTDRNGRQGREADIRQEPTLSQHVGKLMRQFTARRKPLLFSLLEFREQKRRNNWVNLTREIVAAHKLHVQLGFGSSSRAVPSLHPQQSQVSELSPNSDTAAETDKVGRETSEIRMLNYARSPFRNEPSPPLLAVAAHANIARYRSLRRVTRKRASMSLLLFSHAERNTQLVNWYADSVRAYDNQSGRTWIERALSAIRENMDTNERIYQVQDDEPFDVGRLGDAIGRFAELCSPLVRVIQFFNHLFQWRNPPATVLAILVCITIAANGLVHYVPASLFFVQAAWIVETKYNWLGLGMGRTESEDAERRQANVLALVAQVHDTLAAAQNVLGRLNRELGKVQLLFLWGSEEWQSWIAVGVLCGAGLILLAIPSQTLFLFFFFFMFFKHFLPPTNPGLQYWQSIPSRIESRPKTSAKGLHRTRKVAGMSSATERSTTHA